MLNFALIGAAGYIAPRHLQAIQDTGNDLVAALDPKDSVGILDRYSPNARFFTESERFDRFLDKQRRLQSSEKVDWISICSPNYLHDAHIRMALRNGCNVICEKPIVINPWNLDAIQEIEQETGKHVHTVLQLRYHQSLMDLKKALDVELGNHRADVVLTYVTRRGQWYDISWKGSEGKSGGVAMNIGIHFFDLCLWLFGEVNAHEVHLREPRRMSGVMELEKARVSWFLSIEKEDLPKSCLDAGKPAFRSLTIDGHELEFSSSFTDLHTVVYRETLAGNGFSIEDARPSVQAVYDIRQSDVVRLSENAHPYLLGVRSLHG